MEFIYNFNALPFLNEQELILKEYLTKTIALQVKAILKKQNRAWDLVQIEAPCLIPREHVNANYTDADLWVQQSQNHAELVLKPETTASSYLYLEHLLRHNEVMPPVAVWQVSKSFRREQDQTTKNCRFKEFYQQEFQCLYSADTKNDYQASVIEDLAAMLMRIVCLPTRIVLSDRLPDYSLKTIDIEVWNNEKWMEICSVSTRKDFTFKPSFKNKQVECLVLEIAIGVERLIYNISKRESVFENLRVENTLK
jgi:glycyl-tRNA synthetase